MTNNLYGTSIGVAERKRLEEFEEPTRVSFQILDGLNFGSLIDAGSGPTSNMAAYIRGREAEYTAFDFREDFATILREKLQREGLTAHVIQADIRNIPLTVGHADVVHERFVLTHLSEHDRRTALMELLKVADQKVILLEWNWGTMRSSRHAALLQRFVDMSFEVMKPFHVDPFFGVTMRDLIHETISGHAIEFRPFLRPEGDYTFELIRLCRAQHDFARGNGNELLAEEFSQLEKQLEQTPITFVPAEIIAAVITV